MGSQRDDEEMERALERMIRLTEAAYDRLERAVERVRETQDKQLDSSRQLLSALPKLCQANDLVSGLRTETWKKKNQLIHDLGLETPDPLPPIPKYSHRGDEPTHAFARHHRDGTATKVGIAVDAVGDFGKRHGWWVAAGGAFLGGHFRLIDWIRHVFGH